MIDNKFNKQQYQLHASDYIAKNIEGNIGGGSPTSRVTLLKKYLSRGRKVFEIGSGGGLDALALSDAGYKVIASDYVKAFVENLRKKGVGAITFDAKNDKLPDKFDAIYANAVFVHFTPDEVIEFLKRAKVNLQNEKLVFLSVIKGEGSERSARTRNFERDFQYYTPTLMREVLEKAGYAIVSLNDEDKKWLQIIASVKK